MQSDSRYAPGTQKTRVSGEVVRWRDNEGPERVDAVEYIELLEAEVEELRKQLERRGQGKNDLLEYLKSLQPQNIQVTEQAPDTKICGVLYNDHYFPLNLYPIPIVNTHLLVIYLLSTSLWIWQTQTRQCM